ncbi:MAG TPA: TauD/TfdA family dioxygenase [Steroidobacteraceae bacterium]|nr:TauD/TfdA family dioxygenase [Steroidobacteraceae bacterium]
MAATTEQTTAPRSSAPATGTVVAGRPMPRFHRIEVQPLTGACGCEIHGVDTSRALDPETLAEVMLAFEHFLVVMFRDQRLTPEQHKAFSGYFGEITELPQAPTYGGHSDMQEVRREADEPESVVPSFEHFHTDSPFLERPPLCIVMRALDVPRYGGDTAFANMYLVYEDLSEGLKRTLEGLKVVYSGKEIWSRNAKLDKDRQLRLREHHGFREDQLESIHPAVRRHPRTGRQSLYVTTAYFKRFVGWTEDESRALLVYLQSLPQRIQYHCRIRWQPDTLIVWDNRFLQHRGIHDYRAERRHLIRTTVMGERPI